MGKSDLLTGFILLSKMSVAQSRLCVSCGASRAVLCRPKDRRRLCAHCFCSAFEDDVHRTIVETRLFKPGERVAIAASGGKDSTVLAHVLTTLNQRHGYGLDFLLLSIDEGITGYRDDSLETVRTNKLTYGIPLVVVSYKDLYGWSMDDVVRVTGLRNNCTFCGVFRRQALDRGAVFAGADKIVTGHNADDIAETVLMNLLRGDIARLGRCAAISTGKPIQRNDASTASTESTAVTEGIAASGRGSAGRGSCSSPCSASAAETASKKACDCGNGGTCGDPTPSPATKATDGTSDVAGVPSRLSSPGTPFVCVPRCKPLKYCFEKEIVLYAHHKRLVYHATECSYSPAAYRGFARELVKELEAVTPHAITDIVASAEDWSVSTASAAHNGSGLHAYVDDDDDDGGGCGDARGGMGGSVLSAQPGGSGRGSSDGASVRSGATSATGRTGKTLSASSTGLTTRERVQRACSRCGYMTSGGPATGGALAHRSLCQACTLLAGLDAGTPRVGLSSGRQAKKFAAEASRPGETRSLL